jgi:nicotinamidase/pyrazinamidase
VVKIVFVDIDTQFDFIMPQGKLYVKGAKELIPALKRLTGIAKKFDIPIFSSLDTHIKDDPEFRAFPAHCVAGSRGQKKVSQTLLKRRILISQDALDKNELFDKIKGCPQLIFQKNTYDIFVNRNLSRALKPFKAAFVYGVALDYCVKYAVLGLLKAGLKVNLVVDAVRPVDAGAGKAVLSKFKTSGVQLINAEDAASRVREEIGE